MRITVNLLASFKVIAQTGSFALELPDSSTVEDAVNKVLDVLPVLKAHWTNNEGALHAHVYTYLNGEDVSTLPDGRNTQLAEGCELDFIPPVAGG